METTGPACGLQTPTAHLAIHRLPVVPVLVAAPHRAEAAKVCRRRLPTPNNDDVSCLSEYCDDMRGSICVALLMGALLPACGLAAVPAEFVSRGSSAGFDPRIVTMGEARAEIKSKPITQRPNRPLHVYGNTVRRRAGRP
jgi:hypothetical protein